MPPTDRPNILFIMTDQQAPNMLSCTGTPWLSTPALDGLAAGGTRFAHAICADPICVPSRMSMATGWMPCRLGAPDNHREPDARVPDEIVANSLGNLMKRAGYATFWSGKAHVWPQLQPPDAGFDGFEWNERAPLVDPLLAFMQQEREEPFFAVASFINPHDICSAHHAKVGKKGNVADLYAQAAALPDEALPPLPDNYAVPEHEPPGFAMRHNTTAFTPAGTMYQTYSERDWRIYRWIYARLTERVDGHIGRLLGALEEFGLADDTLVVFVSDHGNMHGNHRLASKMAFYEESVRVPLILRWPGAIPAGRVDDVRLVNTGLDLLPTFCDYAGVEAPAGLFGLSLRPAAEGREGPAHPFVVAESTNGRMVRDRLWKYCVYPGPEPRESLVDLQGDPGELTNLAVDPAHADTLAHYRGLLRQWCERTADAEGLRDFVVA